MEYDDEYSACDDTYATLCIYPGGLRPEFVTEYIGLEPSRVSYESNEERKKFNGWFLTSQDELESKDSRRHIDWLLDKIEFKRKEIIEFQNRNFEMYIFCMWASKSGNGGPTISPKQMKRLVSLNLEVSWDVYC